WLSPAEISKDSEENSAPVNVKPSRSGTSISSNDTTVPTGRSCGPATTDPSTGSANSSSMASPSTSHDATTVKTVLGCVKKCEQSLVFFCVVTLPEGQRRLGVYPRPVPGCGNRVQSGVAFGCRTPRH